MGRLNSGAPAASTAPSIAPPFPRWRLIRAVPQAVATQFRLGLGLFVVDSLPTRLFFGVLPVPPGHPRLDLIQADVHAADEDDTDVAPVTVDLSAVRFHSAVVCQRREAQLRLFPERLLFLRGIDAGDPDLVLDMLGVEQRERIAVADADDSDRKSVV